MARKSILSYPHHKSTLDMYCHHGIFLPASKIPTARSCPSPAFVTGTARIPAPTTCYLICCTSPSKIYLQPSFSFHMPSLFGHPSLPHWMKSSALGDVNFSGRCENPTCAAAISTPLRSIQGLLRHGNKFFACSQECSDARFCNNGEVESTMAYGVA